MDPLKRTPLYDWHVSRGGRIVPFAGWEMPVQYAGLREEHTATREAVGFFDVSHMGEIRVSGPKALETLQWLTTNDVAKLQAGDAQYSLFPNENGGVVDDLIVYCLTPNEDYLLCVNASNKDKDLLFVQQNNRGATIVDESDSWAQVALQGPRAVALIEKVLGFPFSKTPNFKFARVPFGGTELLVARTGYTGEDGGEIFAPREVVESLTKAFFQAGEEFGLTPCGLGARDTLRTEMRYPLYGQEIDDQTNPYAAGLGWVVKPKAKDFLGKEKMLFGKENGFTYQLVGIALEDKGIARHDYKVFSFDNKEIGRVTSGTLSPSINKAIAVAYVERDFAALGTELAVEMRGRKVKARVVETPFYKKPQ